MINEKKNWLWAGWVASYLQRSLAAQVNFSFTWILTRRNAIHPDANTDRLKQSISAVRASGDFPGNETRLIKIPDLQEKLKVK